MLRTHEQQEDARIKGKRKYTTIPDWLIPLAGSSDCVLVKDDMCITFKREDTQIIKKAKIHQANKDAKAKKQNTIDSWLKTPQDSTLVEFVNQPFYRKGEG